MMQSETEKSTISINQFIKIKNLGSTGKLAQRISDGKKFIIKQSSNKLLTEYIMAPLYKKWLNGNSTTIELAEDGEDVCILVEYIPSLLTLEEFNKKETKQLEKKQLLNGLEEYAAAAIIGMEGVVILVL
ncbi:hypothetical protein [Orientia tsutsugamushi]|uniref:Uncharacterized protein n=1 Tax=Orientia tsutsugamushi TaxID=784 RepID=A0A2U3RQC3_ORITS|nr:hypothetical protein [Orientia tsutsugamushi]KJV51000.1 hypothetical protein OTSKARP_1537 [Orientia tsutsugamushi str. Karp]SPR15445.1 Uncharacterised protein [Orientia tsutsugamushi]